MFEWELSLEQEREAVGAGRYTWGGGVATSAMASPRNHVWGFFALQADRLSMCAGLFCSPESSWLAQPYRYAAYSVNRLPIPNVTTALLIVISSLSAEGSAGEDQSSGDASSVPGSGTIATRYVSALADLDGLLSPWSLTAMIR